MTPERIATIREYFADLVEKIADIEDAILYPQTPDMLVNEEEIERLTDLAHYELHKVIFTFQLSGTAGTDLTPTEADTKRLPLFG